MPFTPSRAFRILTRVLARLVQVVVVFAVCLWLVSRGWDLAALLLAGVAIYVFVERSVRDDVPAPASRAADEAESPAAAPAPSPAAPDAERVLAWFRTTLTERVPERGRFPALSETLWPEARRLSGLAIHLTVAPYPGDDPADENLRRLEIKVEAPGGSSIWTDIDLGSVREVVARIDAGERTAWTTRLLERAAAELWHGGENLSLEARVEIVRAGRHAVPPEGPDCDRFTPERMGGMENESLLDSDRLNLWLVRCPECGQRFVEYWMEIWEDTWIFITRISEDEAALIRRDYGWAPAILLARRRITGSPGRGRRWEEGHSMELRMGPRW